mgnify:FL=1
MRQFAAREGWSLQAGILPPEETTGQTPIPLPGMSTTGEPEAPMEEILLPGPPAAGATTEELLRVAIEHLEAHHILLAGILLELREQVPQGIVYSREITVTSDTGVEVAFPAAMFSIGVTNDGASTVQYRIPNLAAANWIDLDPTEVDTFSFLKGRPKTMGLRVTGSATVRIKGTY